MTYINRHLTEKVKALSNEYACILLTGPRQVGKTTLLEHAINNDKVDFVTLDDMSERKIAMTDPELFLNSHKLPIVIDEVQYAPELFSYIKIAVDKGAAPGSFYLTGSQSFKLMRLAQESLAGRVAIIQLSALSQSEILGIQNLEFKTEFNEVTNRNGISCDMQGIYKRIFEGGMPALISKKYTDRDVYYSSYIKTFIERDVSEEIEGVDKFLFSDFIRACACRIANELNIHSIAMDVGISDDTAKRWLAVLEKSEIIFFVHPFSNNLLKRTVKNKKMYFFDTGIVAHLLKYSSSEVLMNDAINGAILENYVINELRKTYQNNCKEELFYYYRDVDRNEIDLIIDYDNLLHPIEIKKSSVPSDKMTKSFKCIDKSSRKRGAGCLICMKDKIAAIDRENTMVPVWMI